MAYLKLFAGAEDEHVRVYEIDSPQCILGRHRKCDVHDAFVDRACVSRRHAMISSVEGQFFLEDLGSRNRTQLNGRDVQGSVCLRDGDRIAICDIEFVFTASRPDDSTHELATTGQSPQFVEDSCEPSSVHCIDASVESSLTNHDVFATAEAKLQALLEMLSQLRPSLELKTVLNAILNTLFEVFPQTDRGFIGILRAEDGCVEPVAVKHRRGIKQENLRVSRSLIEPAISRREAVLSVDPVADDQFVPSESLDLFRDRTVMCAPLLSSGGHANGVVLLDSHYQPGGFQNHDLEVLVAVARLVALSVEYADLHRRRLREKAIDEELELAQMVQQSLLMFQPPSISGYEFFAYYRAAERLSGDYYEFLPLPDSRLAVILADAAEHGPRSAMLMSLLSGDLKYYLGTEPNVVTAVNRLNGRLSHLDCRVSFVTLIVMVIDPTKHDVTLVNAGHMDPILCRKNGCLEIIEFDGKGMPIGVDEHAQYSSMTFKLAAGETITCYTDGLTDATNGQGLPYGLPRLRSQHQMQVAGVTELGKTIVSDVLSYSEDSWQFDDICLVCMGRTE